MKLLQVVASALAGLGIAAALAAVPDIADPAAGGAGMAAAASATSDAASRLAVPTPVPTPAATRAAGPVAPAAAATDETQTAQQRAIVRAVRASDLTSRMPDAAYTVRSIHVSDEGTWATAMLVPDDPGTIEPAVVLVRHASGRWSVSDLGTFEVGCERVPSTVHAELHIGCS